MRRIGWVLILTVIFHLNVQAQDSRFFAIPRQAFDLPEQDFQNAIESRLNTIEWSSMQDYLSMDSLVSSLSKQQKTAVTILEDSLRLVLEHQRQLTTSADELTLLENQLNTLNERKRLIRVNLASDLTKIRYRGTYFVAIPKMDKFEDEQTSKSRAIRLLEPFALFDLSTTHINFNRQFIDGVYEQTSALVFSAGNMSHEVLLSKSSPLDSMYQLIVTIEVEPKRSDSVPNNPSDSLSWSSPYSVIRNLASERYLYIPSQSESELMERFAKISPEVIQKDSAVAHNQKSLSIANELWAKANSALEQMKSEEQVIKESIQKQKNLAQVIAKQYSFPVLVENLSNFLLKTSRQLKDSIETYQGYRIVLSDLIQVPANGLIREEIPRKIHQSILAAQSDYSQINQVTHVREIRQENDSRNIYQSRSQSVSLCRGIDSSRAFVIAEKDNFRVFSVSYFSIREKSTCRSQPSDSTNTDKSICKVFADTTIRYVDKRIPVPVLQHDTVWLRDVPKSLVKTLRYASLIGIASFGILTGIQQTEVSYRNDNMNDALDAYASGAATSSEAHLKFLEQSDLKERAETKRNAFGLATLLTIATFSISFAF